MRTDKRIRADAGFTLIEVMAAMVVLAVGLLGLQALGIGAARSIARADQQSQLAAVATAAIETRQREIRSHPGSIATGESCTFHTETTISVCVRVDTRSSAPSLPVGSAQVSVRASHPRMARDTFSISSYVYDPALP